MRFRKILVSLSLFLILFSSAIAQKIVEDIKPEKQFKKLTDFKDKGISFEGLDWTPDGKFIVYSKKNKIYKLDVEKGKDVELFTFYTYTVKGVRTSPSGKKIGIILEDFFSSRLEISIKNLENKRETKLMFPDNSYSTGDFIWSHDEKKLIFPFLYGNEYYGIGEFNIEKRKFREIRRLSGSIEYTSVAFRHKRDEFYILVQEDYKRKIIRFHCFDLIHKLKKIINVNINMSTPFIEDIDCDGENILFTALPMPPFSEKYGYVRQLFKYNLKNSILYILTREKEDTYLGNVRYSPDCKKIAFFSNRDGAWNIWLLNLEEEKK